MAINGRGRNFQNFGKLGSANKLKWTEKIENLVIDPPLQLEGGEYSLALVVRVKLVKQAGMWSANLA